MRLFGYGRAQFQFPLRVFVECRVEIKLALPEILVFGAREKTIVTLNCETYLWL